MGGVDVGSEPEAIAFAEEQFGRGVLLVAGNGRRGRRQQQFGRRGGLALRRAVLVNVGRQLAGCRGGVSAAAALGGDGEEVLSQAEPPAARGRDDDGRAAVGAAGGADAPRPAPPPAELEL